LEDTYRISHVVVTSRGCVVINNPDKLGVGWEKSCNPGNGGEGQVQPFVPHEFCCVIQPGHEDELGFIRDSGPKLGLLAVIDRERMCGVPQVIHIRQAAEVIQNDQKISEEGQSGDIEVAKPGYFPKLAAVLI